MDMKRGSVHPAALLAPPFINDPEQLAIPCLFMRGGSSRGGFFLESELPSDPLDRAAALLGIYGSPDARQIDGIGGSDPLTSKAAIVARSARDDADLDYTFCQVDINRPKVSTGGNCGNMLSAVAPYGILRGLIPAHEGENTVRVYTTNTDQVVTVRFQVKNGVPCVNGETIVPGVPGTGSTIAIDFGDCAGSVSGKLLPTGQAKDEIRIGDRSVSVSLVDAATPFVFVNAEDVDGRATATPEEIQSDLGLMDRLEAVRGWAATVLGLVAEPDQARMATPNMPRVIMVSRPQSYRAGETSVDADEIDLCVRQLAMQKPHKALAVTGAVCTAVASQVPGTVVQQCLRPGAGKDMLLGHPSGILSVSSDIANADGQLRIMGAAINRTARLLMAGVVYVPHQKIAAIKNILEH